MLHYGVGHASADQLVLLVSQPFQTPSANCGQIACRASVAFLVTALAPSLSLVQCGWCRFSCPETSRYLSPGLLCSRSAVPALPVYSPWKGLKRPAYTGLG